MSTKIHIGLSTNYLHGACLSEGQRVDMKVFPTLWASGDWKDVNFVVADKGYDVYQVVKLIRDTGRQPIIPRRRNALFEGVLPQFEAKYRSRFAIEHFFSKLKENKRLALRFDKLDLTFFLFSPSLVSKFLNYFVNSAIDGEWNALIVDEEENKS